MSSWVRGWSWNCNYSKVVYWRDDMLDFLVLNMKSNVVRSRVCVYASCWNWFAGAPAAHVAVLPAAHLRWITRALGLPALRSVCQQQFDICCKLVELNTSVTSRNLTLGTADRDSIMTDTDSDRKIWQPLHPSLRDKLDPEYVTFHDRVLQYVQPSETIPWDPAVRNGPSIPPGGLLVVEVGIVEDVQLERCRVRVFVPEGEVPANGWKGMLWFHGGM